MEWNALESSLEAGSIDYCGNKSWKGINTLADLEGMGKVSSCSGIHLLRNPYNQILQMKTLKAMNYRTTVTRGFSLHYQPETLAALDALSAMCPGTVAERDAVAGFRLGEPLLIMVDQAIRWAKAYRAEFDRDADYVAAPEIGGILSGIRGLLNFDGAAKWEGDNMRHDTKDNGLIETLYWKACRIAGIDGDSI